MSMPSLMTSLSLLLNLAVLVPVCGSLLLSAPWTVAAYGPPSPARWQTFPSGAPRRSRSARRFLRSWR